MRPTCDDVRLLIERDAAGELTRREFLQLDRHLEGCPSCAARRRRLDPLGAFVALRGRRPADPEWAGLWEGVRAGVQGGARLGLRERLALLRPAWRLAAAAALVVTLGLVALRVAGPAGTAPRDLPALPAGDGAALATVESIGSPRARVCDLKVYGEGDQVAEVVLIFDEEIDL